MASYGLQFIMKVKPKANDRFLYKDLYKFISPVGKKIKMIIELEIYERNIAVLSFFPHKTFTEKNKYKARLKLGAGHIMSILKACLEVYKTISKDHALILCATNDIGENVESNKRYSAYSLFLSRYLLDYDKYEIKGSLSINTLMLIPEGHHCSIEAHRFYEEFERHVQYEADNQNECSK